MRKPRVASITGKLVELEKATAQCVHCIAQKTGMKPEDVVDAILKCDLDIYEYTRRRRARLARLLKIKTA